MRARYDATSHKPQATSHKPQATSHKPKRLKEGFTLIEMMVVIGIIAILGAVVVPGFKKIYSDFKIMETRNMLNTILSAMRSFYLIHNEGTGGLAWNVCEDRLLPFLSGSEWTKNLRFKEVKNGYKTYYTGVKSFYLFSDAGMSHTINAKEQNYFIACYKESIGRPYYLDDLLDFFRKKGYITAEAPGNGSVVSTIFYFPENQGKYFR